MNSHFNPSTSASFIGQSPSLAALGFILGALFLFTAPPPAAANSPDENAGEISSLKREVSHLKGHLSPAPHNGGGLEPPKLKWRGFGHLQYEANDDGNHFAIGDLDLFINSRLASNLSFLSEVLIEFDEDGENGLDVERLLLKYQHSDALAVSLGRGHTGLGYWNQAFHHGVWLQTTTGRPLVYELEDEGGFLPVHFIGAEFSGRFGLEAGDLIYIANVANGRGRTTDSLKLSGDDNDSKMLSLLATFEPAALPGFGVGASVLFDHIPEDASVGRFEQTQEIIAGINARYVDDSLEAIAEWFIIDHQSIEGDSQHDGGYAQLAYAFDWIKPYYRFDFLNIESGDTFFANTATARQQTLGIRFDLFTYAAVKTEYRYLDSDLGPEHTGVLQVSFTF